MVQLQEYLGLWTNSSVKKKGLIYRKVVQLKSIKVYASIPKGMMGCGCSLLHCQVHEFLARWKACYEYLFVCVKRNKMDSEFLTCLLKFIEYFPDYLSALSHMLVRFFLDNLCRNSCISLLTKVNITPYFKISQVGTVTIF